MKKILVITAILALMLSMSACTSQKPAEASPSPSAEPTAAATTAPTAEPTAAATAAPSAAPTSAPSAASAPAATNAPAAASAPAATNAPAATAAVSDAGGQTASAPHTHTVVVDAHVDATCTKTGLTQGSHCSVCGEILVPQEVIPMTEHTYQNGVCIYCGAGDPTNPDRTALIPGTDPFELPH